MCIYFKIQHFHGVKENRGISGYNHQIERCLLLFGEEFLLNLINFHYISKTGN